MWATRITQIGRYMIYAGTCLLSILSFFTTYYGLRIILPMPLALAGSLGLQVAMLGTAWTLMLVRRHRGLYVIVFTVAASFSVFFSYVNFNTALQQDTRVTDARQRYTESARPVLSQYAATAQQAAYTGRYQMQRIEKLIQLEKERGWATVVDEGSEDPYIQTIIDGARRTVESWQQSKQTQYPQGAGEGIIVNYLESQRQRTQTTLFSVDSYVHRLDSLMLELKSTLPVDKQYELVNRAWVDFPTTEVGSLTNHTTELREPPEVSAFTERAKSLQESLGLVIADLLLLNRLAVFALLLALSIDLIVIVLAFAGSYAPEPKVEDDEAGAPKMQPRTSVTLTRQAEVAEEAPVRPYSATARRREWARRHLTVDDKTS